jgi:pimeloyl-ACP methyl ester carboxylesterase
MKKWAMLFGLALSAVQAAGMDQKGTVQLLQTPSGVRFGILGQKGAQPAPTLFAFGLDIQSALAEEANVVGVILARRGFLCVSLDVPCHGADARPGEPGGLSGWRARLEKREDFVSDFVSKSSAVREFLVREGYTDARKIVVAGTSRGGFVALHFAAADPNVRCVVGFAPVTDLLALSEFEGTSHSEAAKALSVASIADKLADRSVWITIGHEDRRVSTDAAIDFTRKVMNANLAWKKREGLKVSGRWTDARVQLVLVPSEGSTGHYVHSTAHSEAAAWILGQLDH